MHKYFITINNLVSTFQLENAGDPPFFENGQKLSYLESVYIVLMSNSCIGYSTDFQSNLNYKSAIVTMLLQGEVSISN